MEAAWREIVPRLAAAGLLKVAPEEVRRIQGA
jgi:hypothetical protein